MRHKDAQTHSAERLRRAAMRDLEKAGILRRTVLPPPAASTVYELTDVGLALKPTIFTIGRWGGALPFLNADAEHVVPSWTSKVRARPAASSD
jgi:hypothetical protein